jgi:hypothetical protein
LASVETLLGHGSPSDPTVLDARRVAQEAEQAVLSLPDACHEGIEAFFFYLAADEPAIHLMPVHFLPARTQHLVGIEPLHELAVAAKLEYARNRWLDGIVDGDTDVSAPELSTHRLNDAILALIDSRYTRVLNGRTASSFFATLARLHARQGLAMVLDGAWSWRFGARVTLEEYIEHAEARHGPVRAPVDAVLLLVGAPEEELRKARLSWHRWALGVQFYDDALDVEEDFRNDDLSWVVSRTLEHLRATSGDLPSGWAPDPDLFYETALTGGMICECLGHAESFFAESARLAEPGFPSWAAFQRECLSKARSLREDYEKLVAEPA